MCMGIDDPQGISPTEDVILNELVRNLPKKPFAKVACIPERGMKCRVVTKSPVGLVTMGD
jgi:hypothetical protein